MAHRVIEGTWEEIKGHEAELAGHYLRVTVDTGHPDLRAHLSPKKTSSAATIKKRLDALNSWLTLPRPPVASDIDDSRVGIYGADGDRG